MLNYKKSIEYLKKSIELNPDSSVARVHLGLAYLQLSNLKFNKKLHEEAITILTGSFMDYILIDKDFHMAYFTGKEIALKVNIERDGLTYYPLVYSILLALERILYKKPLEEGDLKELKNLKGMSKIIDPIIDSLIFDCPVKFIPNTQKQPVIECINILIDQLNKKYFE